VTGTAGPATRAGDEDRLARAALSRVGEPGTVALVAAVRRLGAAAVWSAVHAGEDPTADLPVTERLPATVLSGLAERARVADPERDLDRAAVLGARLVVPGDPEWPERVDDLARLGTEPLSLWVRGPLQLGLATARAVAVVGSRAATAYGQRVAGELGAELADRGWATLSGGAYGVDGCAHRGSLAAGGATVAVLAGGVDVPYPRGHAALLARIADEGAVVSEWPPGAAPARHRFLTRNRVIAAMTAGTVVVEAAQRSGARSTAATAARLLRPCMAVPGPVTSATSAGCHALLRQGATCVTGTEEVLEELGRPGEGLVDDTGARAGWRDALGESARRVLEALPVRGWAGPAQVARVAGVDQLTVLRCLGPLEREGLVEGAAGRYRQSARARR